MACSLTKNGPQFSAAKDAKVTVKVIANATTLVSAEYNEAAIPVNSNSTTFTVVTGSKFLWLDLAGPQDTVLVVEDCGGGETKRMFRYEGDFHPALGFSIVGA